jgi:hypothetical protein
MDESPLYWKQMPEWSFIQNEAKSVPGFKASKDRITVLLGGSMRCRPQIKTFCDLAQ